MKHEHEMGKDGTCKKCGMKMGGMPMKDKGMPYKGFPPKKGK